MTPTFVCRKLVPRVEQRPVRTPGTSACVGRADVGLADRKIKRVKNKRPVGPRARRKLGSDLPMPKALLQVLLSGRACEWLPCEPSQLTFSVAAGFGTAHCVVYAAPDRISEIGHAEHQLAPCCALAIWLEDPDRHPLHLLSVSHHRLPRHLLLAVTMSK